ncbi:GFA family protein [Shewanella surugensis]|uniref:GFA family protein n=1 Tax=Shewanella surugensis TaxID=212020 RepID=A0ABT0L830_9GAMM|nr:GFA family protein [Shewanella surugensis]MCL1123844.1 GFA family protein [Shewanella surugensis]
MKDKMVITGECFCGEVRYQVDGQLRDARSCHCSRCRKAFSAQASAYALVEPQTFSWLSGQHLLTSYASKQGFGLQFCCQCGSTLCGTFNGVIHGVTLGCLNGDPDIVISRHLYVGSKASWEVIPNGVHNQISFYEEKTPEEP